MGVLRGMGSVTEIPGKCVMGKSQRRSRPYHGEWLFVVHHLEQVVDDLSWIVVRDLGTPASTDTICTVNQYHGQYGYIPLRLYTLVIIIHGLEQRVIVRVKYQLRHRTERQG